MKLGEVAARFPGVEFRADVGDEALVFVKSNHNDVFGPEVVGLDAMRETNTIRVVEVVGCGASDNGEFVLVLELIRWQMPGRELPSGFFQRFARQLAEMHRAGTSQCFGFKQDNFLGASHQPNSWSENWTEFWAESRLGYQLKLARDNGRGGAELQKLGAGLISRLDSRLGYASQRPSLIHGDLWGGNWICDRDGQPVLIDPAAYYADREAEFGMTTLFPSLPQLFYDAYNEAWPMAEGWQDRVAIYRLYHLLNHLNLFGGSYLAECLKILWRFN